MRSIGHRATLRRALGVAFAFGFMLATPAVAAQAPPANGPIFELRYRYESVDDDAFARNAEANTVRLRLGYHRLFANGWQLHVDGEHVAALFGEHYNSTANGKVEYPVVADPRSSEINQAYVGYADTASNATLGRQRIVLDNQRFFGNSGWRQNEQTFDALSLQHAFGTDGPSLRYTYLDRVLRVNGHSNPNRLLREWNLNGNLLNLVQSTSTGTVAGYAYLVENKDIATLSTRTFGARWTGTRAFTDIKLDWTIEYARQADWANNPQRQRASYRLIEPVITWNGVSFKAGWEVLGGDGHYGFATPYATLHAFNGWADRFTSTPAAGLDDKYIGASSKFGRASWVVTWHDFRADHGGRRFGSELDASLGFALSSNLAALLKFADYDSHGFASDERKLWLSLEYRL